MTAYALFRNNEQISKAHSTKGAALAEAYETKVVISTGLPDFPGDGTRETVCLAEGYEIKELP